MDFKKCTSIICSNILVIILFFFNFFYLFFFFITRKEHDIKKSLTFTKFILLRNRKDLSEKWPSIYIQGNFT